MAIIKHITHTMDGNRIYYYYYQNLNRLSIELKFIDFTLTMNTD